MLAGVIKKRSPVANTKFRIEGERRERRTFSEKNIKKSDVLFIITAPRVVSLVYNDRYFFFKGERLTEKIQLLCFYS